MITLNLSVNEGSKGKGYDMLTGAFILALEYKGPQVTGREKNKPFNQSPLDYEGLDSDIDEARITYGQSISIDEVHICKGQSIEGLKLKGLYFNWLNSLQANMRARYEALDNQHFLNGPFNRAWASKQYDVSQEPDKPAYLDSKGLARYFEAQGPKSTKPSKPLAKGPFAQAQEAYQEAQAGYEKALKRLEAHQFKGYQGPKAQRAILITEGLAQKRDKAFNVFNEARLASRGLDKSLAKAQKEIDEGLVDLRAWQKKHKPVNKAQGPDLFQHFQTHYVDSNVDLRALFGAPIGPVMRPLDITQISSKPLMSFDDDTNSFRPTKELEAHLGACPLNVGLFTWYKPLVNKPLEGQDEGSYCSWPYIQKIEAGRLIQKIKI